MAKKTHGINRDDDMWDYYDPYAEGNADQEPAEEEPAVESPRETEEKPLEARSEEGGADEHEMTYAVANLYDFLASRYGTENVTMLNDGCALKDAFTGAEFTFREMPHEDIVSAIKDGNIPENFDYDPDNRLEIMTDGLFSASFAYPDGTIMVLSRDETGGAYYFTPSVISELVEETLKAAFVMDERTEEAPSEAGGEEPAKSLRDILIEHYGEENVHLDGENLTLFDVVNGGTFTFMEVPREEIEEAIKDGNIPGSYYRSPENDDKEAVINEIKRDGLYSFSYTYADKTAIGVSQNRCTPSAIPRFVDSAIAIVTRNREENEIRKKAESEKNSGKTEEKKRADSEVKGARSNSENRKDGNSHKKDEYTTRDPERDAEKEQFYQDEQDYKKSRKDDRVNIRFITNNGDKFRLTKRLETEVHKNGDYRCIRFAGTYEPIYSDGKLFTGAEIAAIPKDVRDKISGRIMDGMEKAIKSVVNRESGVVVEEFDTRVLEGKWKARLIEQACEKGQIKKTVDELEASKKNNEQMARNVFAMLGMFREVRTYPASLVMGKTVNGKETPVLELRNVGQKIAEPALRKQLEGYGLKVDYDRSNGTLRAYFKEAGKVGSLDNNSLSAPSDSDYNSTIYIAARRSAETEVRKLSPEKKYQEGEIRSRAMQVAADAYIIPEREDHGIYLDTRKNSVFAEKHLAAIGLGGLAGLVRRPFLLETPIISQDPTDTARTALVVQVNHVSRKALRKYEQTFQERGIRYSYNESMHVLTLSSCDDGIPIFNKNAYTEPDYNRVFSETRDAVARGEAHLMKERGDDKKFEKVIEKHHKNGLDGLAKLMRAEGMYVKGLKFHDADKLRTALMNSPETVFDDRYNEIAVHNSDKNIHENEKGERNGDSEKDRA